MLVNSILEVNQGKPVGLKEDNECKLIFLVHILEPTVHCPMTKEKFLLLRRH